jgi:hypothetical protein
LFGGAIDELALIGGVDWTDGMPSSLGEQIINDPLLFSRCPIGGNSEIDIDVGDVGNSLLCPCALRAIAQKSALLVTKASLWCLLEVVHPAIRPAKSVNSVATIQARRSSLMSLGVL